MKRKIRFWKSGLWLQPLIMGIILACWYYYDHWVFYDKNNIYTAFWLSMIPVVFIWKESTSMAKEEYAITGKEEALRPPVPEEMLSNQPEGIVLGKFDGKYVRKPLGEDGHCFVLGGSGSMKSAAIAIPTLLANPNMCLFAVDIKGELSYKSRKLSNPKLIRFNPQDRSSYGYDPLWKLNENSSGQDVLETMQTIVHSLISMPPGLKDPFWKSSARSLFLGLLLYYYKQGYQDFIGILDQIMGRPVKDQIKEAMERTLPSTAEYRYINTFSAMEDETLGGIVAEMNLHILPFANDQDLRYAFKENGVKFNPSMLEEGYSIFLSIREQKLTAYYDVLQLIINQTLSELENRSEDSEPIIFILDELPRLLSAGKMEKLLDGARTLRSRKVCLLLISQSTEALSSAFSEAEVDDLLSNCAYTVILQAKSNKTQKTVCGWCGKYKCRKQSWSGSGADQKINVSYEEKDLVEPSDLITLPRSGELILISPYGYNRIKKTPYFKDPVLKPMANEVITYNKSIAKI